MKTIKSLQLEALDMIGRFLTQLEFHNDPFEIEAAVGAIHLIAGDISKRLHELNKKKLSVR